MINNKPQVLTIDGVPGDEVARAKFNGWIDKGVRDLLARTGPQALDIRISNIIKEVRGSSLETGPKGASQSDELTTEQRAEQYASTEPLYQLRQLIVPSDVLSEIESSVAAVRVEAVVYDTWGLRKIEPFPRSALNFHGPPGTGKTLAAHGIAASLSKKILVASYAQIESKFHGDGPKNVEGLFFAAQRDDAVLFIDESDSLLSRRLTNVTQGSEQAINSMRSQLLICLEKFRGVVIFATNLVENYDPAFETRVRHIHFPMPNAEAREAIWRRHLPSEMPLSHDVSITALAEAESDFCGRDIKNAVVNAATRAAIAGQEYVTQANLLAAVEKIVAGRRALRKGQWQPVQAEEPGLFDRIRAAVDDTPP